MVARFTLSAPIGRPGAAHTEWKADMPRFARRIRPFVNAELSDARAADQAGDARRAFAHLERAHVLSQASTLAHVRVHWRMLRWGLRQGHAREVLGQVVRIVGAATKTAVGLVPAGNTGGANVNPFRRLPIAPELAAILRSAQRDR